MTRPVGQSADARLPSGIKILDRLRYERRITDEDYQKALLHAQRTNEAVEDAIIDTGVMTEADLLRYLAGIFKTRFVSTDKLAKATVERIALEMLPRKLAEKLLVFPILFDRRKQTLSVVACDVESYDVARQVQLVCSVREVTVYVARPASIRAAIRKHYGGDITAFERLVEDPMLGTPAPPPTEDMIQSGFVDPWAETGPSSQKERRPSPPPPPTPVNIPLGTPIAISLPETGSVFSREAAPAPPVPIAISMPQASMPMQTSMPTQASMPMPARPAPPRANTISYDDYLEMLNVMVTLVERDRGELRGHSSQAARLCRKVCEKLRLPEDQVIFIVLAAYLHDLGKTSTYHLTALNVAQYEGHRTQAQKTYLMPLRWMESVKLPEGCIKTITHMYERFDGAGFPDRFGAKEIPLGARVLAIVDTYLDLTSHAKNPYRKKLEAKEACEALTQHGRTLFDPDLLDVFRLVVLGDELKSMLLAQRRTVLLVDPDPEDTTVLEIRLAEHGYDVAMARSNAEGIKRLKEGGIDVIVTEVDVAPTDGFELIRQVQSEGKGETPIVFLTRLGDRATVTRAFEAGVADYLVKPVSADVIAAKIRQILDRVQTRVARGVSGSLREMSLPDVIQILSNGRKNGRLTVRASGKTGELFFGNGAIFDAKFGDKSGTEAVYAMLFLQDGDFVLDPEDRPTQRVIHESTEALLLEGMRRLDEGRQ